MAKFFKRVVILLLLVGCTAGGYYAWDRWGRVEPLADGLVQANGRIEGDHVTVASKFAGKINEILVREGESVEAGQVLARLSSEQVKAKLRQAEQAIEAARAQHRAAQSGLELLKQEVPLMIDTAQASLEHAKAVVAKAQAAEQQSARDASRFSDLASRGTIDKRKGEEAQLAWTVAKNDVRVAETALTRAEKQLAEANLGSRRVHAKAQELEALAAQVAGAEAVRDEAQSVLDDLTITAPAAGVITTRVVDAGEIVAAGSPLFDLVNLDRLYLKVYVPEIEIGHVRLDLPARIHTDAFPDNPFPATVRYVSSRAEFTPKEVQTTDERVKLVYAVKLYLDENPDHQLTPGLPADAVMRWKEETPWMKPQW
ncbi:putative multidrug resistance protein EmrK [Novipirellula galeiformis]|uniref:Putative multidrug resistance protein EmrK n=1 Tax=Novipirellula galeiformis TaxID=2528004 RepID=A0A5C6CB48_9BACT|nr:efflux RND transporter periplasmic adaptor subunit [Novipirellula galeiformis]TWU21448.1 putative multidrug resistance protein EmrK [Novipirellula galeiformis]